MEAVRSRKTRITLLRKRSRRDSADRSPGRNVCYTVAIRWTALTIAMAFQISGSTAQTTTDMPTSQQIVAAALSGVSRLTVRPEDYVRAGQPDDTGSIQAALDTGNSVVLSANRTYIISRTLLMHAGQRLTGEGKSTVLKAGGDWVPPKDPLLAGNQYSLISNDNFEGAGQDRSLVVENLSIDATDIALSNGGFHGIGFRNVANVLVRKVSCVNIGDCTAFQGTASTLVMDCDAVGVTNVAFDHWEGPRDAIVENVKVRVAPGGDGVMFTAASGWPNSDRIGSNLRASHVTVHGPASVGVTANVLTPGGVLRNVTFEDCYVDVEGHPSSSGIIITGNVQDAVVRDATIRNINGGQAVAVTPDKWNSPTRVAISKVVVTNVVVSKKNVAPVVALGQGHRIENVVIQHGTYNYAVWVDSAKTTVQGDFPTGLHGNVLRTSPRKRVH